MGAFVGISVSYFFKSFRTLFFNLRLFEKARNSQRNIESLNKRILILEDLINKQSPELIRWHGFIICVHKENKNKNSVGTGS